MKTIILSSLFLAVSFWSWKSLYNLYKQLKSQREEKRLFQERHNTVLMWAHKKGLSGWVPGKRIEVDIRTKRSLDLLHEPVVYFINTAKATLNIAYMTITVEDVFSALLAAKSRGVNVRLLMNFEETKCYTRVRELMDNGIEVLMYIGNKNTIMHNKFMVKDFTEISGYTFMGSINLSDVAFFDSYEDAVITSNWEVARAFHDNFQKCWEYLREEYKTSAYRAILAQCNLIQT